MALHQHATEFRARNLLLHLCLGLRSHGITLRELLDRYAAPDAPRVAPAPGDDRLVLATLGLAAFFDRLETHLQRAAASAPPAPAPSPPAPASRGLLR